MGVGMELQKEISCIVAIAEVVVHLPTDKLLDRVVLNNLLLRGRTRLCLLGLLLFARTQQHLKLFFAC